MAITYFTWKFPSPALFRTDSSLALKFVSSFSALLFLSSYLRAMLRGTV